MKSGATTSELITGAIDDAQQLFRKELALAREEIRRDLASLRRGAISMAVALVTAGSAAMLLLSALALGVAAALSWPAWAGFALVGLLTGGTAAVFFQRGRRTVKEVPRHLTETAHERREEYRTWIHRMSA